MNYKYTYKSKDEFTKDLGKKVAYFRELRGLTLQQLADLADCTAQFISAIEKGKSTPNAYALFRISQALHAPLEIFYGIKEEKEYYDEQDDPIFKREDFGNYFEIAKEAYLKEIPLNDLKKAIKILMI